MPSKLIATFDRLDNGTENRGKNCKILNVLFSFLNAKIGIITSRDGDITFPDNVATCNNVLTNVRSIPFPMVKP